MNRSQLHRTDEVGTDICNLRKCYQNWLIDSMSKQTTQTQKIHSYYNTYINNEWSDKKL
jgi:hypothetical protein